MVGDSQIWQNEYPHTLRHRDTTLHLQAPIAPHTRQAFERLIEQSASAKRVSAPLACSRSMLFTKREKLDSLKKKLRMQRGRPKRNGMYDWSLEELINTREAARRGARVPKLVGYGYSRSRLGLMQDFFLITELLSGHEDGLAKVRKKPEAVHRVIAAAFELLHALHCQGVTHMDLWAANVMLPEEGQAQAIDLENSFSGPTAYASETLGFQFGFFYYREIYRYITEADYDAAVECALAEYFPDVQRAAFNRVYALAKHEEIGRLERREIFTSGVLESRW
ncbi:lipopolysaccharide kinase InaA family protein [Pseudomonas putida]|uniref:lipopolysaccharide kinase InaA family protein n=1 Tax=Pseudomonas putida TaxID=303 RepID=UPI0020C4A602|nr:lipopolysaccharide kinase InaA family protein [Pseudomonas putida]UTL82477.1 lipopolysaccharide kinase InaA family protein [Pseudomonas putida]